MAKRGSSRPAKHAISKEWRALLLLIPGYDPIATAGDAWFDPAAAQRALDFFSELLKHVEGECAGKPFALEPWQKSYIANLFGWMRKDSQGRIVRRYRETFLYIARKNGKTPLAAGICLYCLFCDGEAGAQVYSAAADKDQASLLYRHAKGMVEQEPELDKRAQIYKALKSIVRRDDPASCYRVLSADANTKHGGNSHLVLIDELHAQPNRDLVDVLQTSMASQGRKQPLLVHITTADFMRPSICNEKYEYACKVRDRIIEDPSFLPVIYEVKPGEDWTDPKVWARANPNLGVSVSLDYLERECKRAKETPSYENTFRRLHLNQRTQNDVKAIDPEKWKACGHGADAIEWRQRQLEQLVRHPCAAGLDLGSVSDLTALVLIFDLGELLAWLPFFWVPEETVRIRSKRDRVPYDQWVRQGFILTTPGEVTDYDKVRLDVNELQGKYPFADLAVDRLFQGAQLCNQLMQDGINVVAFGQGFMSMAAPVKDLFERIAACTIDHGNNPVLTWMASNAATEEDAAGNQKLSKKKSTEKIDGLVAGVMATGRFLVAPPDEPSISFL